jgi:hypothetical protein
MTRKEIEDLFSKHSDAEYLEHDKIPKEERLHPSRTLSGYLKLASLMKDPSQFDVETKWEETMWLCVIDDLRKKDVTEADVIYLLRCGISYDESSDCLVNH